MSVGNLALGVEEVAEHKKVDVIITQTLLLGQLNMSTLNSYFINKPIT